MAAYIVTKVCKLPLKAFREYIAFNNTRSNQHRKFLYLYKKVVFYKSITILKFLDGLFCNLLRLNNRFYTFYEL